VGFMTVSWIIAGAFTLHVMGALKHTIEADEYPRRMGLPIMRSARRVRKGVSSQAAHSRNAPADRENTT